MSMDEESDEEDVEHGVVEHGWGGWRALDPPAAPAPPPPSPPPPVQVQEEVDMEICTSPVAGELRAMCV